MKYLPLLLLLAACHPSFNPTAISKNVVMLGGAHTGGTGFVVRAPSGQTYILTNRHVCQDVMYIDNQTYLMPAKIIEVSQTTDLCLIEAPGLLYGLGLNIAEAEPEAFDPIHIIGWGMLMGLTLTDGTWVGRLPEVLGVKHPAYATASILPGNSGSPVLNDQGEVVGVAYASGDVIDNRAFIVPLEDIQEFLSIR